MRDGLSKTLMYAEVIGGTIPDPATGSAQTGSSVMGDIQASTMGGAFVSEYYGPNSTVPDKVMTCPADIGDSGYPSTPNVICSDGGADTSGYASARSRHPGGVNAALADGSVHFVDEGISIPIWQALGTIKNAVNSNGSTGAAEPGLPTDF